MPNEDFKDKVEGKEGRNGHTGNSGNKGNKRGYKGKKFNPGHKKSNDKKGKETDPKDYKHNDPKFYTKYASLADTAAKIAFNHRNGAYLQFRNPSGTILNFNFDPIMVIDYLMNPGISLDKMSGINVAAEATYKVLNRKYRGSLSSRYQAADLGIIMFAVTDFFVNLAAAERVYGLCQKALVNQKQLPRQLLLAMGFDFDEITSHLADFRLSINNLIIRAQSLCLLKGTSLLDHHLFLNSNVFKDKDTNRAQYIVFTKPSYWLWDPESLTTGSMVRAVPSTYSRYMINTGTGAPIHTRLASHLDIIRDLSDQLSALLDDSDIDAVCSDILAYYGNDNPEIVRLSLLPEEYSVEAVFDEDVLKQLHNTVISEMPIVNGAVENDIQEMITPVDVSLIGSGVADTIIRRPMVYQENGTIKFELCNTGSSSTSGIFVKPTSGQTMIGKTSSLSIPYESVFDLDLNNPNPDQVMEYTRNMYLASQGSFTYGSTPATYYYQKVETCGSTFVYKCRIFTFRNPQAETSTSSGQIDFAGGLQTNRIITCGTSVTPSWSKFDWAPIVLTPYDFYGDLDNYIVMDLKLLRPIHNVALLSEFHNPVADLLIEDR